MPPSKIKEKREKKSVGLQSKTVVNSNTHWLSCDLILIEVYLFKVILVVDDTVCEL